MKEGYYYCVKELHGNPSKPIKLEMLSRRMLFKHDAEFQIEYYQSLEPDVPKEYFFIFFREEPYSDKHREHMMEQNK